MGEVYTNRQRAAQYIVCCLSVLWACFAVAQSVETEHQFGFVSVKSNVSTTVVSSCNELASALSSDKRDDLIVVIAYIRCDPKVWDKAIVVAGNKTVTGPGHGLIVGAVDWGNGQDMVVVGNGSSITFQDIILMQDFLGANAMLNLPFLSAGMAATAVFKGVAVGVRVCPQPVGIFDERLRELERPAHIPGEQEAARLGVTGLFVTDVAFSPYDDSTWRQCNVVWRCGTRSALDPEFLSDFNDELVRPICGISLSITDMASPLGRSLNNTQSGQRDTSGSETDKAAIGISLTVLGIFFIIVIVGVIFALRYRATQRRRKADELQRRIQGASGYANGHRGPPQQQNVDAPAQFRPLTLGSRTSSGNFPNVFNMDLADVELGKRLGRGKFGSVYKCSYKGVAVAVKVVDHHGEGLQPETGEPLEAELCKQMHHVNVLTTYLYKTVRFDNLVSSIHNTWNVQTTNMSGSFMDSHFSHVNSMQNLMDNKGYRTFIVMEYCNGGSLLRGINAGAFFTQETGPFVMRSLLTALDVARGMSFLHDMCIVHGDLRPESCLVRSESSDKKGFVCKVGDFGLSRYVADSSSLKASSVGSTAYAAPELLKHRTLTKAADVYSMGMILWRLVSDVPAYKSMTEEEIVDFVLAGQRPELPDHLSKGYRELVEDCWHQERSKRPPFHEIVERLQGLIGDAAARAGDATAQGGPTDTPRAETSEKTWEMLTASAHGMILSPKGRLEAGSPSYRKQAEGPSWSAGYGTGESAWQGSQLLSYERAGEDRKSSLEYSNRGLSTEGVQTGVTMTNTVPSEQELRDSVSEVAGNQGSRFQPASSEGGPESQEFESERNSDSDRGSSHGRGFLTRFLASRSSQGTPRHQDQPASTKGRGMSFSKKVADSTSPPATTPGSRFQVSLAKSTTSESVDRQNKATGSSSTSSGVVAETAAEPCSEDSYVKGGTASSTLQLAPCQATLSGNGELSEPSPHLEPEQMFTASTPERDEGPRPRAPLRCVQDS